MSRGGSILEHCAQALPTYSVPRRVIALATFPTLPNGKINLTALAAAGGDALPGAQTIETAKAISGGGKGSDGKGGAKRFATDSLGMIREVNAGAASSLAREMAVADAVRAFLMYGVVMDHFAGCADGSTVRECERLLLLRCIQLRLPLLVSPSPSPCRPSPLTRRPLHPRARSADW